MYRENEIPSFLKPDGVDDRARWNEQSLRYRMLNGEHRPDVQKTIQGMFGREFVGELNQQVDLSRNSFKMIWQQLSTAYLQAPEVSAHDAAGDPADLSSIISARLWPQRQTADLWALAIRESLFRLDWHADQGVQYRPVSPDVVVCSALPNQADKPGRVQEYRQRIKSNGQAVWTVETWDIMGPTPSFMIEELSQMGKRRADVTQEFMPGLEPGAYPYLDREGQPILPYILIHAEVAPRLWSYTTGTELVNGSLRLAAFWTYWGDSYLSASHPQRWALDVTTRAGDTKNIGGKSVDLIPVNHKSILVFRSDGPTGGSLGQYQPAMNPLEGAAALREFEAGLGVYAGLSPSDLKVTSGQSGYAIVVSQAGKRRQQKRSEPARRMADQDILATAAKLANAYEGTDLPEEAGAYAVRYPGIGESIEERKAKAEIVKTELEMGLISRVEAYRRLNPEIQDEAEIMERLINATRLEGIVRKVAEAEDRAAEAEAARSIEPLN
jgi:hypothetical protein